MLKVKFKKLEPNAVIPRYAHGPREDAGMDLIAAETVRLTPREPTMVKTGLAIELPPYVEAQIRPRSGLALKSGITVFNSPGTVDPGYRGPLNVILWWSPTLRQYNDWLMDGTCDLKFIITPGDRIAQVVFARYEGVEAVWDQDLAESKRGSNGFGSTGVNKVIGG